eukprot:scaffold4853_cov105-Isochrysis_galbana.AAC.1
MRRGSRPDAPHPARPCRRPRPRAERPGARLWHCRRPRDWAEQPTTMPAAWATTRRVHSRPSVAPASSTASWLAAGASRGRLSGCTAAGGPVGGRASLGRRSPRAPRASEPGRGSGATAVAASSSVALEPAGPTAAERATCPSIGSAAGAPSTGGADAHAPAGTGNCAPSAPSASAAAALRPPSALGAAATATAAAGSSEAPGATAAPPLEAPSPTPSPTACCVEGSSTAGDGGGGDGGSLCTGTAAAVTSRGAVMAEWSPLSGAVAPAP